MEDKIITMESKPLMSTVTLQELMPIIRNNLCCHLDKTLSKDLLDTIIKQVNDSIDYFLDRKEENI
jgi:hypothetical protein